MAVNGTALAAVALGSVFAWAGIKGTSVLGSIQDIIQGKQPRITQTNPINQPAASSPTPPGGQAPGAGANGGALPGSSNVPLPRINPPSGGGGGSILPPIQPPQVAPPITPPTHITAPPPPPWWDPRGWF